MAALAYLLPPVTGFFAFVLGGSQRMRFHGLQSVIFGVVWPLALYAGSLGPPSVTQLVFFGGVIVWPTLLVGAAVGKDFSLPGVRDPLRRAAQRSVRAP